MISSLTSSAENLFKVKNISSRNATSKSKILFRKILDVLSPGERKKFYLLSLLDVFTSVVDIFAIAFLLGIVQFYVQPAQSRLPSILSAWLANKNSIALIAVFFLLFAAKNFLAFFIIKAQNELTAAIAVRISENNLLAYQSGGFNQFVNTDSSIHMRKIALQPFEFCQYLLIGVQQIITQSSLIIISVTAIVIFNATLFLLLLLILMPPVIGVFLFIKKRLSNDKLQIKTSNQMSFQHLMDALKGYVEANIYDSNKFFQKRFVEHREKYSYHLFDSITIQTLPARLVEIFAVMGLFVLIVIANWSGVNDGKAFITIGAFMAAAYKIIPGIVKIVNTASLVKAHESSLIDMANVDHEVQQDACDKEIKIHSVEFSNVSFQYNGLPVLSGLSFSIEKGDFIGISGKSGKGKTTILNLMLGFLYPACGSIKINNETFLGKRLETFWPSISYVRQQSYLLHDTILRNITLGDVHDGNRLQYVIEASLLNELISGCPEGVNRIIVENGKNISGGQQQRISLARALYKDSNLILLDEPFNELDEASEKALLQVLKQLANEGKMVVMVTHNTEALSFCNKIISLDEH